MTTTLPPSGDTPAELAEHLASGARLVEAFHLMPGVARAMREAADAIKRLAAPDADRMSITWELVDHVCRSCSGRILRSVMFRPRLSVDGNQWCALYGDNLQDGVAGFGDSPTAAMWDFDRNWNSKLPAAAPEAKP